MSETRNASVEEAEAEEEDDDKNLECKEIVGDKNQDHTTWIQSWDDDIIDISELDMEDDQTWLLKTNTSELSFDIGSWLQQDRHKDSRELGGNIINDNNEVEVGSTIDTRTFTRSKKKMSKLNLDSIRERALSTLMYNDDSGSSSSSASWNKIKINWKEEETRNEDCIPAMLRQSSIGILPPVRVNAQESLEAFLNISQSKGIDSFINMAEPEFNESLMNISRPSFLHTTLGMTNNIAMADSQILTDSMMQTSMFNDVENDNFTDDLENNSFNNETMHRNWFDSSTATTSKSISLLRHDNDDESFTPIKCHTTGVEIFSNIDNQQESFTVNQTFDRLPSDSTCLSNTITLEDGSKIFQTTTMEVMNSTQTFSRISLNSTFKSHELHGKNDIVVEEMNENTSSNSTYVTNNDDEEINFPSTQYTDIADTENNEPKSLDMTYSKRDLEGDLILENDAMMPERGELSTDLPANRYQTYRKSATVNKTDLVNKLTANSGIGKMPLNYVKNYQGKSMEMLNKVGGSIPLYSQDIIYTKKFNGPKSLARLPQTLQKSNPNLPSHNSTVARGKSKKIIQQSKFGFQSAGRGILKNGQPKTQGECEKLETRNSNDSIESTLSTYSGPDFDDGLSTCSDGSRHHFICEETRINSEQLYKTARMQEEKLNQKSTPKSDRKILDNTWIASDTDLPSPILKNNEIIGKQVSCCSNSGNSEIQTSSPLLSPAESLQSLAANDQNHTADQGKIVKPQESLPFNKLSSVLKPPQNLESKTDAGGVRLPISRSSNLPSGIPRPASRIPAPRFSRTNAQIKSQNNLKKSLF